MNRIGLDQQKAKELSTELNSLLANYQIFYMNTRGYHWNIKGEKFFELHVKFEEIYNDLLLKVDEIAERVLTLGENQFMHSQITLTYLKLKKLRIAATENHVYKTYLAVSKY